ncbi:hypothetical protein LCGC14_2151730 [marine sediment metagenome]|uniref:Uncharacterized protein n=1 Tax=marine sediment metagenome TaxID=412755 RepID=A0A0F9G8F3_9ZZZZ|nr:hypothetical protein [Porticoccus sp.]
MSLIQTYENFSLKLRTEMVWDKELFSKLFEEMKTFCVESKDSSTIDRGVAAVFWNASWWVKQQIDGIEKFNSDYYINATTNLDHLAWTLFEKQERGGNDYEPI